MLGGCHRRGFLRDTIVGAAAVCFADVRSLDQRGVSFELSLTEQSLTRSLIAGTLTHLDFARFAKTECEISAIEYASKFFGDKAQDDDYLEAMNTQAANHGVRQLLIMIVGESHIGDADVPARRNAFRAHCQWIEVAKALGCHSIQVDATSSGSANQQRLRAIDGLNAICEYAAKRNINVLVGDYGGVSANPAWVLDVITTVNMPGCGTLPQIKEVATDQDYEGLASIVPFARGIRATTTAFDDSGHEKHTDYDRAMKVVQGAGYGGYVGIHYSGIDIDELAGIRATKSMLERIRRAMPSSADERPS